ncbi:MAG: hypothetical protein P1U64_04005 [Alcanivoracaceae bacterium]|nr:hypothetical protein [Alcanivoracaceae bacterium]
MQYLKHPIASHLVQGHPPGFTFIISSCWRPASGRQVIARTDRGRLVVCSWPAPAGCHLVGVVDGIQLAE